ncbi:hypothetical protein [Pseudomonas wadenswilerensis]|uniref:hypothetical protein n=1 Tax=Pseudomonas wadenswilerensis TaxID=1785161 RepID=UPI002160E651|nr:hypothetical protein [Pseudomonas wadenswilerensis]UVM20855.1 hypothetical protein LOY45_20815 [Pseudomonas wadenswilerensis]
MSETPECKSPVERESDELRSSALPQLRDSLMNGAQRYSAICTAAISPVFRQMRDAITGVIPILENHHE